MINIAVDVIRQMIVEETGVPIKTICSGKRSKHATQARVMMARSLFLTAQNMGLCEIAQVCGYQSHFSAKNALNRFYSAPEEFKRRVNRFIARYREELAQVKKARANWRLLNERETELLRLIDTFSLETLGYLTREEVEAILITVDRSGADSLNSHHATTR